MDWRARRDSSRCVRDTSAPRVGTRRLRPKQQGGPRVRISSGVPGFDSLIEGGIPAGLAVIVQGPAGREKDRFLFQFVVEGLRGGGSALVVLSSTSPAKYLHELRQAGVDPDRAVAEDRLKFVD